MKKRLVVAVCLVLAAMFVLGGCSGSGISVETRA